MYWWYLLCYGQRDTSLIPQMYSAGWRINSAVTWPCPGLRGCVSNKKYPILIKVFCIADWRMIRISQFIGYCNNPRHGTTQAGDRADSGDALKCWNCCWGGGQGSAGATHWASTATGAIVQQLYRYNLITKAPLPVQRWNVKSRYLVPGSVSWVRILQHGGWGDSNVNINTIIVLPTAT